MLTYEHITSEDICIHSRRESDSDLGTVCWIGSLNIAVINLEFLLVSPFTLIHLKGSMNLKFFPEVTNILVCGMYNSPKEDVR